MGVADPAFAAEAMTLPGENFLADQMAVADPDAIHVVRERLRIFANETAPIVDYYRAQGIVTTIDATGEVAEITKRALDAVAAVRD